MPSVMHLRRSSGSGCPLRSRGFSLIELLVAVLVMGIGVLGVTALQMVSLQNNRSALERAQAVQLAYDMMDRIRANPDGAYSGLGFGDGPPSPPGSNCMDPASTCDAAQMTAFDQAMWKCMLGAFNDNAVCVRLREDGVLPDQRQMPGMPGGDGAVEINGAVVQVSVQWTDADGSVHTVAIDSQE